MGEREERNQQPPLREEADIAEYITEIIYEYISRELGDDFFEAEIEVAFRGDSVEVSVDAGASPLVEDERLNRVVERAAELGVVVADMIKEGVIKPGDDKRRVLKEALRRLGEST
ncbi:MAG: hypothetical protein QXP98_05615 [Thermoproteus sp.]